MNTMIKLTHNRVIIILCIMTIFMAVFAGGCDRKTDNDKDPVTYRFVTEYKIRNGEITEDDLGDIRTDGEFVSYSSDNMLRYIGYYQGLDFVTLVFEKKSPITLHNAELYASNNNLTPSWPPVTVDGILYREEDGKKYITFKFETRYNVSDGVQTQWDAVQGARCFILPASETEPMSYFFINTGKSYKHDENYCASVGRCTQKDVLDRSTWTDYKYDFECDNYSVITNKWEHEILKDNITDNMPIE